MCDCCAMKTLISRRFCSVFSVKNFSVRAYEGVFRLVSLRRCVTESNLQYKSLFNSLNCSLSIKPGFIISFNDIVKHRNASSFFHLI